jgi:hypothetical protein
MRLPSDFLPGALAKQLPSNLGLFVLGLLTLAFGEPMRAHSDALINQVAPFGILSLQFSCGTDAAKIILNSWASAALLKWNLLAGWLLAMVWFAQRGKQTKPVAPCARSG